MIDEGGELQRETPATNFSIVENALIRARGLSAQHKLLWLTLCSYHSQERGCFPSLKTLAGDMNGVNRRTVRRLVVDLIDFGLLRREERRDEGKTNLYTILWPHPLKGPVTISRRGEGVGVRPFADMTKDTEVETVMSGNIAEETVMSGNGTILKTAREGGLGSSEEIPVKSRKNRGGGVETAPIGVITRKSEDESVMSAKGRTSGPPQGGHQDPPMKRLGEKDQHATPNTLSLGKQSKNVTIFPMQEARTRERPRPFVRKDAQAPKREESLGLTDLDVKTDAVIAKLSSPLAKETLWSAKTKIVRARVQQAILDFPETDPLVTAGAMIGKTKRTYVALGTAFYNWHSNQDKFSKAQKKAEKVAVEKGSTEVTPSGNALFDQIKQTIEVEMGGGRPRCVGWLNRFGPVSERDGSLLVQTNLPASQIANNPIHRVVRQALSMIDREDLEVVFLPEVTV